MYWKHHPVRDACITQKVWARIHKGSSSKDIYDRRGSFADWCSLLIANPAYSFLSLLLIVAGTLSTMSLILSDPVTSREQHMLRVYRQVVAPATSFENDLGDRGGFHTIDHHRHLTRSAFVKSIDWIEQELLLETPQFQSFKQIHEHYYDEIGSLYTRLISLENEYRQSERQRIAGKDINLLDVYDNMNAQNAIYQQALGIQHDFMNEILRMLNPEQQSRYTQLVMTPSMTPIAKQHINSGTPI